MYLGFQRGITAMPVALGSMLIFFFMQPITLDSPHKKFYWILNKNSTASEQNDVLFLENKGTTVPLRIYPTLIYLLYLTKDLAKKKKITMVKPFARSSGMDILK